MSNREIKSWNRCNSAFPAFNYGIDKKDLILTIQPASLVVKRQTIMNIKNYGNSTFLKGIICGLDEELNKLIHSFLIKLMDCF